MIGALLVLAQALCFHDIRGRICKKLQNFKGSFVLVRLQIHVSCIRIRGLVDLDLTNGPDSCGSGSATQAKSSLFMKGPK